MMTVLQNMLRKANFELFGDSGPFRDSSLQHAAATFGAPLQGPSSSYIQLQSDSRCDVAASNNLDSHHQASSNIRRSIRKKQEKNNSKEIMLELCKDEHGGVDEELSQLANDLFRMDSRDRFKSSERLASKVNQPINLEKGTATRIPRRGSEGFSHAVAALSPADIEQWSAEQWENKSTTSKIREFSARQHKMDVNFPSKETDSRLSGFSLFSADMIEYLEDLENVNVMYDTNSVSSREETDSPCTIIPQSPQDDDNEWEDGAMRSSPSQENTENYCKNEPLPTEENGEDETAFVTGVFRDVASKYEISDTVVGSGGFGEVRECYDKKTRKTYVVKSISKPEITDTTKVNLIRNEILLLHEAHHPNIVELRDLFEDDKYVHIVMERCTGGDLFDRVVSENPRQLRSHAEAVKYETRTAHVMRSILHVLKYLHSKFIVHRDIKPEHFLLTTDERETQKIKLIDFGLARKHKPGTAPMKTFTGSPSFVAPEVIARKYDNMCDMFSVGVTAYFLLTGMLPFDGPTDQETFDLISVGKFKFPSSLFLSDDAKDFIAKLLVVDPKKRLSAGKALNHPWLLRAASC
jgi:calcium-dependent protein kinase